MTKETPVPGQIWTVVLDNGQKRPCVVASLLPESNSAVVLPIVSRCVNDLTLALSADELRQPAFISSELVIKLPTTAFLYLIGKVTSATMEEIRTALCLTLDLVQDSSGTRTRQLITTEENSVVMVVSSVSHHAKTANRIVTRTSRDRDPSSKYVLLLSPHETGLEQDLFVDGESLSTVDANFLSSVVATLQGPSVSKVDHVLRQILCLGT